MVDRVDALYIYGGPEIEQLLEILPDPTDDQVSVPDYVKASNETVNDFHKNVHKLHNHFSTMVNKDSARCKFDGLTQGDQSMATFYVSLKQQAEKCRFPDADDAIRSKILQTMVDKRLRREAMLKEFSLTKILQEAANREDVERQAKEMEKMSLKEDIKQVYTQRKQKKFPRGKQTRQPTKSSPVHKCTNQPHESRHPTVHIVAHHMEDLAPVVQHQGKHATSVNVGDISQVYATALGKKVRYNRQGIWAEKLQITTTNQTKNLHLH